VTPVEVEQAQNYVTETAKLENDLRVTREAYDAGVRLLERHKATVDALTKQAAELNAVLQGAPDKGAYDAAMTALAKAQAAQQQYNDLKVQLGIAEGRLEDAKSQLKDSAAALARVVPQRTWKALVEQARELLHRDALPSEVVAWYATSLVAHTMNYLKLFEVSFSVIVTPDLGLMAIFPDKAMPVAKLSGGEKNMLNISMRLAMADLFPSDLRVLVLDEVEVHLDQTNVAKLPVLLEKVKCLARNRGLVVLFVSHHPSLRDIADNVVYTREVA
jgi:DNA repair exonuclease SbcCD ATPase subunit